MLWSVRSVLLLGTLCLLATPGSLWGSEEVDSSLERWIGELSHPVWHQRQQAEERIALLGESALPQLLERLSGSTYSMRIGILYCLARIPASQVVEVLIEYLDDPVPEVARAAAVALTGREPESTWLRVRGLTQRTFRHETGRVYSRRVVRTLLAKIVEGALIKESPELGGVIYYNGQFSRLSRFGKEVPQALLEMVRLGDRYPFEGVESFLRLEQLMTLARQALLDLVDPALEAEYRKLAGERDQDTQRAAQAALYRLGKPSVLTSQIQMLEASLKRGRRGAVFGSTLDQLSNIYYRVERYDDAVRCYRKKIALGAESPVDHYNLACSLSRLNRVEEALMALETAFVKGYSSRDSLMRDGDLANLRQEARFRALVGK